MVAVEEMVVVEEMVQLARVEKVQVKLLQVKLSMLETELLKVHFVVKLMAHFERTVRGEWVHFEVKVLVESDEQDHQEVLVANEVNGDLEVLEKTEPNEEMLIDSVVWLLLLRKVILRVNLS